MVLIPHPSESLHLALRFGVNFCIFWVWSSLEKFFFFFQPLECGGTWQTSRGLPYFCSLFDTCVRAMRKPKWPCWTERNAPCYLVPSVTSHLLAQGVRSCTAASPRHPISWLQEPKLIQSQPGRPDPHQVKDPDGPQMPPGESQMLVVSVR